MNVRAIKTRIFREGEDLLSFIAEHVPTFREGMVLAITSKIVALSEGRTADPKERGALIEAESEHVRATKHVALTIKDGMVMANAGIDDSNADGKIVLLPKDSFAAAERIRSAILQNYRMTNLGVVITDSRVLPLRAGVVGVALGYAGFGGIKDYRGTPDIFGRVMHITQTNIADSLATAATVEMGEGSEQQPLALIEEAPVSWQPHVDKRELLIDIEDDMYGPLFTNI